MGDGAMRDLADADLVVRAVDADRAAFAAIYDRYADRIHDFCWSLLRHREDAADATQDTFVRAAERLGQLRDPSMLRPWLYAIARRESLARLRARRRQVPDERLPEAPDLAAGPESEAGRSELRDLVRDAAAGLGDRDRVLLELHLRQGLDGAELASAAGVRSANVYVMLGRFRERVERSLGALLVARLGRADCPDLDAVLTGWDGRFSVLIRKRVARHVDACAVCAERRRTAASPLALLSAVPVVTAPPELREVVLRAFDARHPPGDGPGGPPGRAGGGRRPWRSRRVRTGALIGGAAGAVTAGIVIGAIYLAPADDGPAAGPGPLGGATAPDGASAAAGAAGASEPAESADPEPSPDAPSAPEAPDDTESATEQDDPGPPVPPGELAVSTTVLDLGAEQATGTVTLSNAGGSAIAYDLAAQVPWLGVDHATGELAGAAARDLVLVVDRSALGEGDHDGTVVVTSATGAATTISVSAAVENPPVIEEAAATPGTLRPEACGADSAAVRAVVRDESEVVKADLAWSGPDGDGTAAMAPRSGSWHGRLGPFAGPGPVTWHVVATDARGNTATGPQLVLSVEPCPVVRTP